jgi:hypothetical protein
MTSLGEWAFAPIVNIKPEELEKAFGQKILLSRHVWIEKVRTSDLDLLTPYLLDTKVKPESQMGVYLSPPPESDDGWISEQVIKILTTFDLLTNGDPVQIPVAIWVGGKSCRFRKMLNHSTVWQSRRDEMSHLKSGLSEQHFRKTWRMIEKACSGDTGLVLCLERFTRGVRHSDARDHILDLTIALESIIGVSTEITFRFSLYLSLISSSNPKEREELFRNFKLLYGLRSTVVHGGSQQLQKKLNKWESNKDAIIRRAKGAIWYYIQFLNLRGESGNRKEWKDHLIGLALGTESFIGGS